MLSGQLWQQKLMTGDGLSGSVLNIDIEVKGIELHAILAVGLGCNMYVWSHMKYNLWPDPHGRK